MTTKTDGRHYDFTPFTESIELTTPASNAEITDKLLADYFATLTDNLSDAQRAHFCAVAKTFGLNPLKREIYAVTYNDKKGGTQLSIITGYETYIKRAELNPNYDGYEVEYRGTVQRKSVRRESKYGGEYTATELVPSDDFSCVCKVFRRDRNRPIVEEVFYDEFNQGNQMWKTKPRLMLKKVAIANAFRKAFPLDFGGMPYTNDELPDNKGGGVLPGLPPQPAKEPAEMPQEAPKAGKPAKSTAKAKKAAKDAEIVNLYEHQHEHQHGTPESPKAVDPLETKQRNFVLWTAKAAKEKGDDAVMAVLGANGFENAEDVPADLIILRKVTKEIMEYPDLEPEIKFDPEV